MLGIGNREEREDHEGYFLATDCTDFLIIVPIAQSLQPIALLPLRYSEALVIADRQFHHIMMPTTNCPLGGAGG